MLRALWQKIAMQTIIQNHTHKFLLHPVTPVYLRFSKSAWDFVLEKYMQIKFLIGLLPAFSQHGLYIYWLQIGITHGLSSNSNMLSNARVKLGQFSQFSLQTQSHTSMTKN